MQVAEVSYVGNTQPGRGFLLVKEPKKYKRATPTKKSGDLLKYPGQSKSRTWRGCAQYRVFQNTTTQIYILQLSGLHCAVSIPHLSELGKQTSPVTTFVWSELASLCHLTGGFSEY